jgi:Zn-dependent peptidase ImmA (M78 family)
MNKSIDIIEKKFDIDLQDIYNVYPVLIGKICQKLNITVFFDDNMTNDYFGNIIKNADGCVININSRHSAQTNMFTIAHELGHFIKHNEKLSKIGQFMDRKSSGYTKEEKQNERQANDFAAELLMPSDKFYQVYKENMGDIKKLTEFFMVSEEVIYFRAVKLGLMFGNYV